VASRWIKTANRFRQIYLSGRGQMRKIEPLVFIRPALKEPAMPKIRLCLLALCTLLSAAVASADTDAVTLKIGDPAPPIKSAKWIKGESIPEFAKGKFYVVEFWATWCGPCMANIPHLSELQKKYKDVAFIGIDCWEDSLPAVLNAVVDMGDKMNYRVACDDGARGTLSKAWLNAAGRDTIPAAFIVDKDSRIAWIGHPHYMDATLKQLVRGTLDPARQAAANAYLARLQEAIESDDAGKIETVSAEFVKVMPEKTGVVAQARFTLTIRKKDYAAANQQAAIFAAASNDDAEGLHEVAKAMLDLDSIPGANLDTAYKMSLRAVELTRSEKAPLLDTAARACFLKGDAARAVELETIAISKTQDAMAKARFQAALDKFKTAPK
jgi:thiol-disulfide isomerase/thioredoxin